MSSCEVVCLSSDDDEKSVPVIVSSRSVASMSSTIEIISDSEDTVVNGGTKIKEEKNGIENDHADAGPSTSGSQPSSPPTKKKKVEFTTLAESKPAKTEFENSPKRKSRRCILLEENKELFDQLLTKCEEVDGTQDIKKGTAKARKHFECAQVEFVSSKEFKNSVQTSLAKINRECVWGHLGELVKQLKLYKEREGDLTGSQKEIDEKKHRLASTDKDTYYQVLKNEQDERLVNKLHKILKKIHKQILKLETQEVDFDDDDDSSYIMLERYKARAAKIYEKMSQLTNYPEHADRMSKRKVTFSGTDIPSVNKCIERFVNQNHCFPDYHDVFKLIETVNTSDGLGLSSLDIKVMASKAFRDIGGEIKRRRQWDVEDSLYIHLDRSDCDTTSFEDDPELQSKLAENGKTFVAKFNQVIEDFTQKQMLEQQSRKEKAKNGDKSGTSSEANSATEDSEKEDGESEEEESSEDEKPVDEEFESDNERDSEAGHSSGHEDDKAEADDGRTEDKDGDGSGKDEEEGSDEGDEEGGCDEDQEEGSDKVKGKEEKVKDKEEEAKEKVGEAKDKEGEAKDKEEEAKEKEEEAKEKEVEAKEKEVEAKEKEEEAKEKEEEAKEKEEEAKEKEEEAKEKEEEAKEKEEEAKEKEEEIGKEEVEEKKEKDDPMATEEDEV